MTAFGGWRGWAVWLLAAAALLSASFYLDAAVQSWMAAHQSSWVHSAMRNVSRWGDWPSHVVVGVIGAAFAYAVGSRQWLAIFAAMVLACALAGVANRVVKVAAGRARPTVTMDAGWNGPRLSSKFNSFPSGHTAASVAFFTALFLARRRVGASLLVIPAVIAFSRLYVAAHHFSDVVAGAILGAVCGVFVWNQFARRPLPPVIPTGA